jgi:hypothetical protein
MYFWPSSTNVNKNMTKVSIECGAAERICMTICIACVHVGQMLFTENKYLLLKRITVLANTNIRKSEQNKQYQPTLLYFTC